MQRFKVALALAIGVIVAGETVAYACNVPVFRYALEHWRPDPYRVTVLHRGPLDEAIQQHANILAEGEERRTINVKVRTLDVDAIADTADRELLAALGEMSVPRIVIQYPAHLRLDQPIWTAPVDSAAVQQMVESPVRQELVRRIIDGETAVWLLLECGDSERDNAAATLLQEELKTLPLTLKLPQLTDSPEDVLLGGPPLRLAFSMLRVPRSETEDALVSMLLDIESDLRELSQPLVFPVFGRGRALLPLVGPGITVENIRGTAAFLTGACSCQVKEQNPGFDLLVSANWDELLSLEGVSLTTLGNEPATSSAEPELVSIAEGTTEPSVEIAPTPQSATQQSSVDGASPGWPKIAGAVGLVVVICLLIRRR